MQPKTIKSEINGCGTDLGNLVLQFDSSSGTGLSLLGTDPNLWGPGPGSITCVSKSFLCVDLRRTNNRVCRMRARTPSAVVKIYTISKRSEP